MGIVPNKSNLINMLPESFLTTVPNSVHLVGLDGSWPENQDLSRCIGVAGAIGSDQVVEYQAKGLNHIVQMDGHESLEELRIAIQMIDSPHEFFDDIPGSLFESMTYSRSIEFDNMEQKRGLVDQVSQWASGEGMTHWFQDQAQLIADELVTNAVINAPLHDKVDRKNKIAKFALRRQKRDDLDIGVSGILGEDGLTINVLPPARLILANDDSRVLMGCIDYYGSLDTQQLMARLRHCFKTGAGKAINFGSGGAGIGTFLIFDLSVSFYIVVIPEHRTFVGCVLPLIKSLKKKDGMPKNIHLLAIPTESFRGGL